jgi:hypothetical protein
MVIDKQYIIVLSGNWVTGSLSPSGFSGLFCLFGLFGLSKAKARTLGMLMNS